MVAEPTLRVRGVQVFEGFLDRAAQDDMLAAVQGVVAAAPFFQPVTPGGRPMRVRMTSAGRYGWYTDRKGYRYVSQHPDGQPWPPIPDAVLAVWHAVSGLERAPDCCLVNYYGSDAKMGMHQDRDEASFAYPVVSVSLGDDARFRIGSVTRGGSTESLWLRSGDVAVMGGEARLIHHGIDKVADGTSTLLPEGGRINLTLRVVDP